MRTLSSAKVSQIEGIIRDTHLALAVAMVGPSAVTKADYDRLKEQGMLRKGGSLLTKAYQYGVLSGNMGRSDADEGITPQNFLAFLTGNGVELSKSDRAVVDAAGDTITAHTTSLASMLDKRFRMALSSGDKVLRRSRTLGVRRIVGEGAAHGESVASIAARLAKATRDSRHDWELVTATELNNLVCEGKAAAIVAKSGKREPRVYKKPKKDACAYCKALYLADDGITPRVFLLSDLIANGTNEDRPRGKPSLDGASATMWKATLDSTHPYCQCQLYELRPGYVFDERGVQIAASAKKSEEPISPFDRLAAKHTCR